MNLRGIYRSDMGKPVKARRWWSRSDRREAKIRAEMLSDEEDARMADYWLRPARCGKMER